MYREHSSGRDIRDCSKLVLELRDVWVRYSGSGRPALLGIDLVLRNCVALVVGPNGSGKTTLIETCLGILKPFRGYVRLFGVDTRSRKFREIRKLCSYVPQDFMKPPYEVYTVKQVISMGLASRKAPFEPLTVEEEALINEVARELGIEDLLDRPIGMLSGGQQQRVFIARALVRRPRALFLDEPFSSVDPESRRYIAEVIARYAKKTNAFVMIVSHDVNPVMDFVDVVIRLEAGRIVSVEEL